MEIDGNVDNVCTFCDEINGPYTLTYSSACTWTYSNGDPDPTAISVNLSIVFSSPNYYLRVNVGFSAAGGGCSDAQGLFFEKNLGTTKPTCLSDLAGDVPFLYSTNATGSTPYTDPDAGCTVDGSTCTVSY